MRERGVDSKGQASDDNPSMLSALCIQLFINRIDGEKIRGENFPHALFL